MKAPQCTLRRPITQPPAQSAGALVFTGRFRTLCLFELCVPLDKLFRAASWEAHGYTTVFVVALDPHDGSNAEARMTYFASQHGIRIAAAFYSGAPGGTLSQLPARRCLCLLRPAAHTAEEFFRRIGILGVGFVASRLANFCH